MKKKKKPTPKPAPKKKKKVVAKAASKKAVKKVVAKKQKPVAKKVAKKSATKKQKAIAKKVIKVVSKKLKPVAKKVSAKKQKPVVKKIAPKVIAKIQKPVAKEVSKAAPKPTTKPIAKAPIKRFVTMPPNRPPAPKIDEPRPKGLYSLEYELNSSPDVLFEFISTPGGLEKWFADRVYIIEGNFIFNWEDGEKRLAKQIAIKEKELVRFHWLDDPEKRYFEFKIVIDDLTSEVALIVSDFADTPKELEELTRLWNQQVNDLHHSIGSA